MVLGSVKDKITKEYLRQSQIKNKIHTKANAHTGTLTICPAGLIQTTGTPTLEHLPFALLDWIQATGTPTICPVGLIHTKANARTGTPTIYPAGLDTHQSNAHTGTPTICPAGLIQTTGTLTICPVGLDTDNWNAYHLPDNRKKVK